MAGFSATSLIDLGGSLKKAKDYADGLVLNGVPVNYPQVVGGKWKIFDPVANAYTDTGIFARGTKIQVNTTSGNWETSEDDGVTWIDTGIQAQGATGAIGATGPQGTKGDKGDAGANGTDGINGILVVPALPTVATAELNIGYLVDGSQEIKYTTDNTTWKTFSGGSGGGGGTSGPVQVVSNLTTTSSGSVDSITPTLDNIDNVINLINLTTSSGATDIEFKVDNITGTGFFYVLLNLDTDCSFSVVSSAFSTDKELKAGSHLLTISNINNWAIDEVGYDDSGVLKLESANTQTLESNIALGKGYQLLGTKSDGSQASLTSIGDYVTKIVDSAYTVRLNGIPYTTSYLEGSQTRFNGQAHNRVLEDLDGQWWAYVSPVWSKIDKNDYTVAEQVEIGTQSDPLKLNSNDGKVTVDYPQGTKTLVDTDLLNSTVAPLAKKIHQVTQQPETIKSFLNSQWGFSFESTNNDKFDVILTQAIIQEYIDFMVTKCQTDRRNYFKHTFTSVSGDFKVDVTAILHFGSNIYDLNIQVYNKAQGQPAQVFTVFSNTTPDLATLVSSGTISNIANQNFGQSNLWINDDGAFIISGVNLLTQPTRAELLALNFWDMIQTQATLPFDMDLGDVRDALAGDILQLRSELTNLEQSINRLSQPHAHEYYVDSTQVSDNTEDGSRYNPYTTFNSVVAEHGSEDNVLVKILNCDDLISLDNVSNWCIVADNNNSPSREKNWVDINVVYLSDSSVVLEGFKINGSLNVDSNSEAMLINCNIAEDVVNSNSLSLKDCEINSNTFIAKNLVLDNCKSYCPGLVSEDGNVYINNSELWGLLVFKNSAATLANTTIYIDDSSYLAIETDSTGSLKLLSGSAMVSNSNELAKISSEVPTTIGSFTYHPQSTLPTNTTYLLQSKQIVDPQTFTAINPVNTSQSAINKALDQALVNATSQGRDRGVVINALSGYTVEKVTIFSIKAGGTGYAVGDILFIRVDNLDNQIYPAWAIVNTVDTNGEVLTATISSPGAFTNGYTNVDCVTGTSGSGTACQVTISTTDSPTDTTGDIASPQEGDTVVVLRDETNGGSIYQWQYADRNGDGIANWIPITPLQKADLMADGVNLTINNGIISLTSSIIGKINNRVDLNSNQMIEGIKFFDDIRIATDSSVPITPSPNIPATQAQVDAMIEAKHYVASNNDSVEEVVRYNTYTQFETDLNAGNIPDKTKVVVLDGDPNDESLFDKIAQFPEIEPSTTDMEYDQFSFTMSNNNMVLSNGLREVSPQLGDIFLVKPTGTGAKFEAGLFKVTAIDLTAHSITLSPLAQLGSGGGGGTYQAKITLTDPTQSDVDALARFLSGVTDSMNSNCVEIVITQNTTSLKVRGFVGISGFDLYAGSSPAEITIKVTNGATLNNLEIHDNVASISLDTDGAINSKYGSVTMGQDGGTLILLRGNISSFTVYGKVFIESHYMGTIGSLYLRELGYCYYTSGTINMISRNGGTLHIGSNVMNAPTIPTYGGGIIIDDRGGVLTNYSTYAKASHAAKHGIINSSVTNVSSLDSFKSLIESVPDNTTATFKINNTTSINGLGIGRYTLTVTWGDSSSADDKAILFLQRQDRTTYSGDYTKSSGTLNISILASQTDVNYIGGRLNRPYADSTLVILNDEWIEGLPIFRYTQSFGGGGYTLGDYENPLTLITAIPISNTATILRAVLVVLSDVDNQTRISIPVTAWSDGYGVNVSSSYNYINSDNVTLVLEFVDN